MQESGTEQFTVYVTACNNWLHRYTVEPPNKGHFGNGSFVLSSEVVPISEVHRILIYTYIMSIKFKMGR